MSKHDSDGFTLLEVLVSSIIFSVLIITVSLITGSIQLATINEASLRSANSVAARIIEDAKSSNPDTLSPAGSPYDRSSFVNDSLNQGTAKLIVTNDTTDPSQKVIVAQVAYYVGSNARNVSLTALISGKNGL